MIQSTPLSYRYPGGVPLHFPAVDLPQGGVLLLTGPSGCGKSTWLALVAGLVQAATGTLTIAGQTLGNLSGAAADAWRAKTIGFLPQQLHLSAALTVAQNLAMAQWAAGQGQDNARIHGALDALGVAGVSHRKPAQLSGGQAQRVALARTVLLRPRVILADEPTASLDDEAAHTAVQLLLHTAHQQGASLVIATHDGRVASAIRGVSGNATGYTALTLSRQAAGAAP